MLVGMGISPMDEGELQLALDYDTPKGHGRAISLQTW
jgi:hypothetical protein